MVVCVCVCVCVLGGYVGGVGVTEETEGGRREMKDEYSFSNH